MLRKTKQYQWKLFPAEAVASALEVFHGFVTDEDKGKELIVSAEVWPTRRERWELSSVQDFLAEYRDKVFEAKLHLVYGERYDERGIFILDVDEIRSADDPKALVRWTDLTVGLPVRTQIEAVFGVFERYLDAADVEPPSIGSSPLGPRIFIGHGHSEDWKLLKDHLHEQHGYEVEAFETKPRAGYSIVDVIDGVARAASMALLVHTAEDEQGDGTTRARENVVHETGLLQGRLGFKRAIVLREDGCAPFSNMAGVVEIRYPSGNIQAAFGDVLSTMRRELGADGPATEASTK